MKHLILSGGGDMKDSEEIDKFFVKILPPNPSILYIPIALDPIKNPYKDSLNWVKSLLDPLAVNNITMWTSLENKSLKDLDGFNAIYIGGGNTFKLLYEIKRTGFDNLLTKYINKGRIVYGGSAGAIILGKNIETAEMIGDVNEVGLKDKKGLNFLNDFEVWCHYKPSDDQKIKSYVKNKNTKVIALSETSGIYLNGSGARTLGQESVSAFINKGKYTYGPGTAVGIRDLVSII